MPDLHALIHRMADELDHYRMLLCDDRTDRHPLATEARAALAEPQEEGPSDEELANVAKEALDSYRYPTELTYFLCNDSCEYEPFILVIRAVLARYGRPTPLPADELLQAYQAGRRDAEADERWAADVAQDLPADGEVGELVDKLRVYSSECSPLWAGLVRRAADLLTRLALQPVPVRERPWERDGWCDEMGRCWWGRAADEFCNHDWHYATRAEVEDFCSDAMPQVTMPFHTLPIPRSENVYLSGET